MFRKCLTVLAALGLLITMAAPAGASSYVIHPLEINSPGAACDYAYASVVNEAVSSPPGSVTIWSQAATVQRATDPCVWFFGSSQDLWGGALKVQGTLVCRWQDNGGDIITQNVWQSPVTLNANHTGLVEVHNGSSTNPCHPADVVDGTLVERTIVDSWVFTGFTYQHYTETTPWTARS